MPKQINCSFTLEELKLINKMMGFALDNGFEDEMAKVDDDVDGVNEHVAELIADNE